MALIRSLIPLGLLHIEEVLDEEVARAGWRTRRPPRPSRRAPSWEQPRDLGLAGQRVPIRVPRDSPCHGARDSTTGRTSAAWRSPCNDAVVEATCCMGSRAAPTRRPPMANPGAIGRRGRRCPARSFRPARRNSANAPGATSPGRTLWLLVLDGKTFAEADDGRRAGHHVTGDKRFLGQTGHRERAGVDHVPPVLGRAGPRCFPGASGDRRWRQGAPGGRAEGLPPPRPGCNGVNGTLARERGESPGQA